MEVGDSFRDDFFEDRIRLENALIQDYCPPVVCNNGVGGLTADGSSEDAQSADPYLLDVENWGKPGKDLSSDMREALWPITFDYFREGRDPFSWDHFGRSSGIQFRADRILAQPIAKQWKVRLDQISVNPENESDIAAFLLEGKLPPKPIRGGIIAGGPDYLVIISESNRRGEPGRLFILR